MRMLLRAVWKWLSEKAKDPHGSGKGVDRRRLQTTLGNLGSSGPGR